jgi:hypothetical protein
VGGTRTRGGGGGRVCKATAGDFFFFLQNVRKIGILSSWWTNILKHGVFCARNSNAFTAAGGTSLNLERINGKEVFLANFHASLALPEPWDRTDRMVRKCGRRGRCGWPRQGTRNKELRLLIPCIIGFDFCQASQQNI